MPVWSCVSSLIWPSICCNSGRHPKIPDNVHSAATNLARSKAQSSFHSVFPPPPKHPDPRNPVSFSSPSPTPYATQLVTGAQARSMLTQLIPKLEQTFTNFSNIKGDLLPKCLLGRGEGSNRGNAWRLLSLKIPSLGKCYGGLCRAPHTFGSCCTPPSGKVSESIPLQ